MSGLLPWENARAWGKMKRLEAENARLKAEVERLDTLSKQLMAQHSDISCENIMLRKAGDALAEVCEDEWRYKLQGDIEYYLEVKPHKIPNEYFLVQRWLAAKEGKQP